MKSILLTLFTAVVLVVVSAETAAACRCDPVEPWNPDVATAREKADYIFFGRAVSRVGFEEEVPEGYRSWVFDVAAVWKGPVSRKGRVYAHAESNVVSSCDRAFEVGVAYVVFAYLEPDAKSIRYRDGLCSLTAEVSETKSFSHEIVRRLGVPLDPALDLDEGAKTTPASDAPPPPTTTPRTSPKLKLHPK